MFRCFFFLSSITFSLSYPILSYPTLSCPYLRHFLRRISLPAPISRIYLFLSFHRQISSLLTLYHCRCFKKPIVFMCISISYVTMYLFKPLHSSFTCPIFFLRAGVFLWGFFFPVILQGEMSQKLCSCLWFRLHMSHSQYSIMANTF